MKTNILSWFDRLMVAVTFAEANVEEPDLAHFTSSKTNEKEYESFGGQAAPA